MPTLSIDGIEVTVEAGQTVLQACEAAGVEVPRFCYHDRLEIAGNCRMCLVEMEGGPPKPIASCAMPAGDNMVIKTNTPAVKKAREGVMEFLLINHPLDCPICDQGGECDLQDQSMAYGKDHSRYTEVKRAVKDKNLGPLVKTTMTRCIHCTRCVRFITDVAGVEELGAVFRGEHTEIGTYVEAALTSELQGNLIDLCPVGALTSKPYAFTARPWELRHTETIDVHDAVGSNVRVDTRGRQVMRVLPLLNEDINEEWISDKTRFACDGLAKRRLDAVYVKQEGKLQQSDWDTGFDAIRDRLDGVDGSKIAAIAGDLACAESMTALKDLMTALGSANIDCRQDGAKIGTGARGGYLFNTTIAGIENADFCLLVGTDPRHEASILNARLRKRYLQGGFTIYSVGAELDATFPVTELGAGSDVLADIIAGRHDVCSQMVKSTRGMIIVGQSALARADGAQVLAGLKAIAEKTDMVTSDWNGFNVLHNAAARVAGLDLGLVPGEGGMDVAGMQAAGAKGDLDVVFLLGADEIDTNAFGDAFVVYIGSHGDNGAHHADVILPAAAYTEKPGTYVNTEGRVQRAERATFPPGDGREDWTILRALSERLGQTLSYDSLPELRARMVEIA
ncbi:MAG: NADH-quinone oxidoreductase subunit G, partial [Alphaproteobacteria bacterium]|nr:NADH-quinone oxidoreductase subunit G [Alphaproteobacteria bacterium]